MQFHDILMISSSMTPYMEIQELESFNAFTLKRQNSKKLNNKKLKLFAFQQALLTFFQPNSLKGFSQLIPARITPFVKIPRRNQFQKKCQNFRILAELSFHSLIACFEIFEFFRVF